MTVSELIEQRLRAIGAEGLVNLNAECGCTLENLEPCGGVHLDDCQAAMKSRRKSEDDFVKMVPCEED